MAAARVVLPLKLLMVMYLALLHVVCLCQAASVTPVDATRTASADHDCCHDAEASPGGEAPNTDHAHHPGCRYCDGSTLLPATDVSGPALSFVVLTATLSPALIDWKAAGHPVPTQVVAPPGSLSHHPPLPVLEQTGILLL